jgi:hypothetical protein
MRHIAKLMVLGMVVVAALGAAPSSALADSTNCTNPFIYNTYQCNFTSGSGLHVNYDEGHFWINPGASISGNFEQKLRITRPNGKVTTLTSPKLRFSCSGGVFTPTLCWNYRWGSAKIGGDYPDQTEMCSATFLVLNNGSTSRIAGWACNTIHS